MKPTLWTLIVVGLAGSLGAISRYLVGHYAAEWFGKPRFPVGTLIINITACFLMGLFVALADRHVRSMPEWAKLAVLTGFIGTYSTFSTYMFEVEGNLRSGHGVLAVTYLLVSIVAGLMAVYAGGVVARGW